MERMARFFALLAGLLLSLSALFPDFGAGDAINLLGISSVAVGFAFRDILQNFLANADLLIYSVIVNTAFPIRCTEVEILIDYRDDIDSIQHLMIESILGLPNVLSQPAPMRLS